MKRTHISRTRRSRAHGSGTYRSRAHGTQNSRRNQYGGVSNAVRNASNTLRQMTGEIHNADILPSITTLGINEDRYHVLEPLLNAFVDNNIGIITAASNEDIRDIGLLLDLFLMDENVLQRWSLEVFNRLFNTQQIPFFINNEGRQQHLENAFKSNLITILSERLNEVF